MGQKQLLCLARALLRKKKLVVMDEPTANVDFETDRVIQHTLSTHFKESTVLTIAHRLESIIHSDLILVLEKGNLVEQGTPLGLMLAHEDDDFVSGNTLFAQMVRDTQQSDTLLSKARASSQKMRD